MLSSGVGGSRRCLLKKKALPGTWYPLPHGVFCCLRDYRLHSRCALHIVSLSPWFYARSDDHQTLSLSYQADEDWPRVPRIYASGSLLNRLVITRDAFAYLTTVYVG